MKFCSHCGTQLADGDVCNCPAAVAERQLQINQQQTQKPPAREGKIFGQKLVEPLTLFFKSPKKAVDNRIKEKDYITPLIYIAALLFVMLGVKSFIYGTEAVKGSSLIRFNFGLTLLAAIVSVTNLCVAYVMGRFVILSICGKKDVPTIEKFTSSFISFGINSIVPMGIMLVGGMFYMASDLMGYLFFVLTAVWYIAACLLEIKDEFNENGNQFVRLMVVAIVIGGLVCLYILLYRGMFAMNVRSVYYDYYDLFNGLY